MNYTERRINSLGKSGEVKRCSRLALTPSRKRSSGFSSNASPRYNRSLKP
ncbi:unnamed protein product [Nesidiocoris tenuis]|uniref:Uncharacterized protein n=1 Tax=Nesidiocoris tenuis TaxID=355587 RepID=A0A6H5FTS2_9HEMI|nr:unnamed protein product [Nesidiocoris tenuis]